MRDLQTGSCPYVCALTLADKVIMPPMLMIHRQRVDLTTFRLIMIITGGGVMITATKFQKEPIFDIINRVVLGMADDLSHPVPGRSVDLMQRMWPDQLRVQIEG